MAEAIYDGECAVPTRSIAAFKPSLTYISACQHASPDSCLGELPKPVMPPAFKDDPHALVWLKNGGQLPYKTRAGVREGNDLFLPNTQIVFSMSYAVP